MRSCLVCLASGLAATFFASTGFAQQPYSGAWGRGIHVFGQLVLDFGWGTERVGLFSSPLLDCSNERFYCASSREINIVVPRKCEEVRIGERWTVGPATAGVLSLGPAPQGHLPALEKTYIMESPGQSYFVYGYAPRAGITWLLYDPSHTIDFVAMTSRGQIADYLAKASQRGKGSEYYYPLTTLDAVARCL